MTKLAGKEAFWVEVIAPYCDPVNGDVLNVAISVSESNAIF